jgi:putative transposase
MAHPPRIPVWLPLDKDVTYFITSCVRDRQPVLANRLAFHAFKAAIDNIKRWQVIAAVLMPDHLHTIATPLKRDAPVGEFVALLKRRMRKDLNAKWNWQSSFFDHLLRADESAQQKWDYMRENPVRAGLVKCWGDWPYAIGFTPPDPPSAPLGLQYNRACNPNCRAGGPPATVPEHAVKRMGSRRTISPSPARTAWARRCRGRVRRRRVRGNTDRGGTRGREGQCRPGRCG